MRFLRILKMKIDNFELIKRFFYFNEANNMFFFLQIVRRAKDHKGEEKKTKEKAIKTYIVTSREYLDSIRDEVILLCEHYGARAYINVAGKDFDKVQKEMLFRLAKYNLNNTVVNPNRLLNRIIGETKSRCPRYLIDIDDIQSQEKPVLDWLAKYFSGKEYYLISKVPTVQGEHFIVEPFNVDSFNKDFPNIDVHKNSMGTLLYYPESIKQNN